MSNSTLNSSLEEMLTPAVQVHAWKSYSEEGYLKALGKQDVLHQVHHFQGYLDARARAQQVQNGGFLIVHHDSGAKSYYKSFGAFTDKAGTLQNSLLTAFARGDPYYQMKPSESNIGRPLKLNLETMVWDRTKSKEKKPDSKGSNAEEGILVLQGSADAVKAVHEQRPKPLAVDAKAETKVWPDVENIVEVPVHDAFGEALAGLQKWEKMQMVNLTKQGTDCKTMFSSQEKPIVGPFHKAWTSCFSTGLPVKNTFIDDFEEEAPSPTQQRSQSLPPTRQDE